MELIFHMKVRGISMEFSYGFAHVARKFPGIFHTESHGVSYVFAPMEFHGGIKPGPLCCRIAGFYRGTGTTDWQNANYWNSDLLANLAEVIPIILQSGRNVIAVLMPNPIQRITENYCNDFQ